MGVRFQGNGTSTSSISFTTINLPNPTLSTSGHSIISQVEHIISDAGIRSSYKKGEAQLKFTLRWSLLSTENLELIQEFLEKISHGNHWFTLQDTYVKDSVKGNMTELIGGSDSILSADNLALIDWNIRPIGKYAFITSGAQIDKRRRITNYGASNVTVSPVFPGVIAIGVTFIIGIPVLILPDEWRIIVRSPTNNLFDIAITFVEKGD